jgi:hypothetical protein
VVLGHRDEEDVEKLLDAGRNRSIVPVILDTDAVSSALAFPGGKPGRLLAKVREVELMAHSRPQPAGAPCAALAALPTCECSPSFMVPPSLASG